MFSATDVKSLIDALPRSADSDHQYMPSLNGQSLVSFAAAKAGLTALVNDGHTVRIDHLPQLLDIRDASSLLRWADQQDYFSTPKNNRTWLPPWMQKTVAIHFLAQARHGFASVSELAQFWHLTRHQVQLIIDVYRSSLPQMVQIGQYWTTLPTLKRTSKLVLALCREAEHTATPKNLSDARLDVPGPALSLLIDYMAHDMASLQKYDIKQDTDGIWFIPVNAIARKSESQQRTSLAHYAAQIARQGFCIVKPMDGEVNETANEVRKLAGPDEILRLEKHVDTDRADWVDDGAVILAKQQVVSDNIAALSPLIQSVASTIWLSTQDSDNLFSSKVVNLLLQNKKASSELASLILHSTASAPLRSAYAMHLSQLAQESQAGVHSYLRGQLSIPLSLYASSLPLCQDPVLQASQTSFLHAHFKSDLIPSALDKLPSPVSTQVRQELSRFRAAANEARNMDAMFSASKRLLRKTRPANAVEDDPDEPWRVRDVALEARLATLQRVKRPSDVLQQATWALLSSVGDEPALWIGAGKDAGRLVKVFRRMARELPPSGDFDWVGAADRLEAYRGAIKAGTESGEDTLAVRTLASQGFEARRRRAG